MTLKPRKEVVGLTPKVFQTWCYYHRDRSQKTKVKTKRKILEFDRASSRMEFTDAETNWKRCAQSRRFTSGKVTKKRAELQNAPYYVIFTVVNENTNARVGTAIISVPPRTVRDYLSKPIVRLADEWLVSYEESGLLI